MRFRFHVPILILALATTPVLTGCAARASVSSAPTVADQDAVRLQAARITDGFKTSGEIVRAAGRFIDGLSISAADKTAFDQAIIAVAGTSARPGPLPAAIDALASVTSEASLKATVTSVMTVLDPLIVKLETSSNLGVAGLGASLRAATLFARNYAAGGVR